MRNGIIVVMAVLMAVVVAACGGGRQEKGGESSMKYASGLEISEAEGYTKVVVHDPWNKGNNLQTYLLVPRENDVPSNMPEGIVVKVPLKNVVAYSDVHVCIMDELGAAATVKGVCDAGYFKTDGIVSGLKSGTVMDCGSSMSPTVEKIVGVAPEAILLSPFQNGGLGALANLGVPVIQLADYMEQTPLGRAEWIKFIGLLFGKEKEANAIFDNSEKSYKALLGLVNGTSERPKVLSETMTSGVWYVPGGKSYKANLYRDAGADYPWASDATSGSLSLDFAQVLDKAKDADVWLVTTYGQELTAQGLLAIYPHNNEFSAYNDHGVYYANTATSRVFEETPFHPELLLKEYIKIFHPEALPDYKLRYYKPMKY